MTRTTTVEMPRTEWMFLFKRKLCRAHEWTMRNGNGKRWKRIRSGARADRRLRVDVETNAWVVVSRGTDSNGCRVTKYKKKSLIDDAFADRWFFGFRVANTSVKISIDLDSQFQTLFTPRSTRAATHRADVVTRGCRRARRRETEDDRNDGARRALRPARGVDGDRYGHREGFENDDASETRHWEPKENQRTGTGGEGARGEEPPAGVCGG